MAELIIVGFMLGGVVIYGSIAIGMTWYYSHKDKQFVKNHPEYIELRNQVIDKGNTNYEWRKLIDQKKKAIDTALAEIPYATETAKKKIEQQLAMWRIELAEINEDARPDFVEHELLRDKLNKMREEFIASGELKEW